MIIISNPQFIPNESVLIKALFEEGLEVLHLRKPDATREETAAFIEQIDKRFHSRIMIHSHYKLLNKYELRGIHFTEKTKDEQDKYATTDCVKSIALHEINDLDNVKPSIDYAFLSPIFPSVSKTAYTKEWDFNALQRKLAAKRQFKVVALGGITLENKHQVKALGFDNFAVLGSIWEAAKTDFSTTKMIDLYRKFKE